MAANGTNMQRDALYQACKVVTGKGILSYAYIWEPRPEEEGTEQAGTIVITDKALTSKS